MSYNESEHILRDLVEIPSVTKDIQANNRVLEYVTDYLEERGLNVEQRVYGGHGSLVATTQETKTPEVMFVAHADVVPATGELFTMREDAQNYYGRGVFDMKCAIAGYLALTDVLGDRRHGFDYGIKIVTNEETGGLGVKDLLDEGFVPKVAILPDGSSDWRIEKIAKGAWNVNVTTLGSEAHGARPWEGESASLKLLDLLAEIRLLFDGQGPETDTLNIAELTGGTAVNTVPGSAGATLDIRVVNHQSLRAIQDKVTAICARYQTTPELNAYFAPLAHDMGNPYIAQFARSITAIAGGGERETVTSYGSSDAVYYDALGVPCVVTRPLGGGAHADDEWISKRDFHQTVPILEHYLTALQGHRA